MDTGTQTRTGAHECTKLHGDRSQACAQLPHHCPPLLEPLLCLVAPHLSQDCSWSWSKVLWLAGFPGPTLPFYKWDTKGICVPLRAGLRDLGPSRI